MRKAKGKYFNNQSGVAAVEFAIIAPVLMLVLFGIIAYGIFFGVAHSVQQQASNSARAAMGGLNSAERQALVEAYVETYLERDGLLIAEHLTVEVEPLEGDETIMAVRVSYDAAELPVWNLYNGLPPPERIIERQSLIRTGGY